MDDVLLLCKTCFYCFYAIPTSLPIFAGNVFLINSSLLSFSSGESECYEIQFSIALTKLHMGF